MAHPEPLADGWDTGDDGEGMADEATTPPPIPMAKLPEGFAAPPARYVDACKPRYLDDPGTFFPYDYWEDDEWEKEDVEPFDR